MLLATDMYILLDENLKAVSKSFCDTVFKIVSFSSPSISALKSSGVTSLVATEIL